MWLTWSLRHFSNLARVDSLLVCRKTALVHAVENNFVPIATALIDAGADVNAKTGDGCAYFQARKRRFASPRESREHQRLRACHCRDFSLLIALDRDYLEMAKLLLLRGADVKLQRSTGYNTEKALYPDRLARIQLALALSQMLQ